MRRTTPTARAHAHGMQGGQGFYTMSSTVREGGGGGRSKHILFFSRIIVMPCPCTALLSAHFALANWWKIFSRTTLRQVRTCDSGSFRIMKILWSSLRVLSCCAWTICLGGAWGVSASLVRRRRDRLRLDGSRGLRVPLEIFLCREHGQGIDGPASL